MHLKSISLAAVAALVLGLPAWAHHSHANYEQSGHINLAGKVTEVHWVNPHVWVYVQIDDPAGTSRVWALEGGSPGQLTRGGWSRDSIKAGDDISVRCHHLKDGSAGCLLGFVTSINGTEMDKEFD